MHILGAGLNLYFCIHPKNFPAKGGRRIGYGFLRFNVQWIMLEYSVKVLPGEMSAVVINLLHDLVAKHLIEITPVCLKGQLNDEQAKRLLEITDCICFVPGEDG